MRKLFFPALLSVLLSVHVQSQDLATMMNHYNGKSPQEKLFIHFDNSVYTPGQTVFYKAYLQSSSRTAPTSTNLYLCFYNDEGKLISRLAAPVYGLTASGSFDIPSTFTGSSLRVLAYTKWMLNFDSAFLFQRTLTIVQRAGTVADAPANAPVLTTLGFYPEGGDLVEGVTSYIACKALDAKGRPAHVEGRIINQNKNVVASFSTTHNGMGKFLLKPADGESYSAEWKDASGVLRNTPLPAAKKTGVVITVNNTGTLRSVSITRSALPEERFKKVSLVATINQQVVFRGGASMLGKERIDVDIPTGRFRSGVLQLTLFDADMKPLAERIVFINNHEYGKNVGIVADTLRLVKKGRNAFHILMPDTLLSSLSLSVTDGDDVNDTGSNILSQLLLSSDIRGKIFNPAFYFSSSTDSAAAGLDLVMLTNGWRRFVWADVINGTTPTFTYKPDLGFISLEGTISGMKSKKPQMMNVLLNTRDSVQQFLPAEIDTGGHFVLDKITPFDTSILYYRINNKGLSKENQVELRNQLWEPEQKAGLSAVSHLFDDTSGRARIQAVLRKQDDLERLKKQTTLQEVIVRSTRMQVLANRHVRGSVFRDTTRSLSFNVLDDSVAKTYTTLYDYLWRQRIPGVVMSGMPLRMKRLDGKPIAIYINEALTSLDPASISMDQIAMIKWFPPPFMDFSDLGGGAFAIYLVDAKDYKDMKVKPPSQLRNAMLVGYSPVREFYSPAYTESQLVIDDPDLRRTLLWRPNIETDGKSSIPFSFFNNDFSKSLLITLEGMSQDGKLVHVVKRITK